MAKKPNRGRGRGRGNSKVTVGSTASGVSGASCSVPIDNNHVTNSASAMLEVHSPHFVPIVPCEVDLLGDLPIDKVDFADELNVSEADIEDPIVDPKEVLMLISIRVMIGEDYSNRIML